MATYKPGQEPERIQKRLQTLFPKLDAAYPDKVIRSLQKDHKKWAETVTELYRLLGYPDSESFLNAYGYTVERGPVGRQSTVDPHAIISELQKRYPNGTEFEKVDELFDANPDLKPSLKTLQNKAQDFFGAPLKKHFMSLGLLGGVNKKRRLSDLVDILKQRYPDGCDLPKTVNQLKEENTDLPIEYLVYSKAIGEATTLEYLRKKGLIQCAEEPAPISFPEIGTIPGSASDEEKMETYIKVLIQRSKEIAVKPKNVTQLQEANPDIPVRSLNRYLCNVKGERSSEIFYIKNGILRPLHETDLKQYTYCEVVYGINHKDLQMEQGWHYISPCDDIQPGVIVVVPAAYTLKLATVRKVIHCLGIEAPWPVSRTSLITRLATQEELLLDAPIQRMPDIYHTEKNQTFLDWKCDLMKFVKDNVVSASLFSTIGPDKLSENVRALIKSEEKLLKISYLEGSRTLSISTVAIVPKSCEAYVENLQMGQALCWRLNETDTTIHFTDHNGNELCYLPHNYADIILPIIRAGYSSIQSATLPFVQQPNPRAAYTGAVLIVTVKVQLSSVDIKNGSCLIVREYDWKEDAEETVFYQTAIPKAVGRTLFDLCQSYSAEYWNGNRVHFESFAKEYLADNPKSEQIMEYVCRSGQIDNSAHCITERVFEHFAVDKGTIYKYKGREIDYGKWFPISCGGFYHVDKTIAVL